MNELLSYLNLCANVRESVIRIPLRGIARNCSCIALNCAELREKYRACNSTQVKSTCVGYPSVNVQGNRFFFKSLKVDRIKIDQM